MVFEAVVHFTVYVLFLIVYSLTRTGSSSEATTESSNLHLLLSLVVLLDGERLIREEGGARAAFELHLRLIQIRIKRDEAVGREGERHRVSHREPVPEVLEEKQPNDGLHIRLS